MKLCINKLLTRKAVSAKYRKAEMKSDKPKFGQQRLHNKILLIKCYQWWGQKVER